MNSIGREAAIALADTKWWETKSPHEIVRFQLFTNELCMPFDKFHEAVENVLNRPVWTHEFASDRLRQEFLGEQAAPTLNEIVSQIPEDKRMLVIRKSAGIH